MSQLFWLFFLMFCSFASAVFAANSEHYQLIQAVTNSAGSTRTAAGKCLRDSLGEAVVGQSCGTQYFVQAGFLNSYLVGTPTPISTPTPAITAIPDSEKKLRVFHSQINPAKGEQARVRWYHPRDEVVTIQIYNLLGSKIATLAENQQFPGGLINELNWDGRSSKGTVVGSGIYIVYLNAGGSKSQTKICVLK